MDRDEFYGDEDELIDDEEGEETEHPETDDDHEKAE